MGSIKVPTTGEVLHRSIQSADKHILSIYCVPGPVLGTGDMRRTKASLGPASWTLRSGDENKHKQENSHFRGPQCCEENESKGQRWEENELDVTLAQRSRKAHLRR